ncbi:Uma2 family endonuclease [Pseudanabaena sp. FACHB-2040]|uniref:Uma2 family endonuclease n=1 Tax=Pseudanabaena sp. FACHB-2040 TaxID=2692859 RepID=UPI00168490D8|nr:Uma2 family endonuclease [Pseudanabaena sp. FACHB-2040]MBD2258945.1 Uma2 family endonuclease [Pseudanabaena sp. FACHB-2040]
MTAVSPQFTIQTYPSTDGEPVAETFGHLYAMLITLEVLRRYLTGQQATVLSNQFLYYAQGFPKLRVAPDVMVIFDVQPGGRDNYKIWEEGKTPAVIFEMTSKATQEQDQSFKKTLYQQLDVEEYWLFDPKGEWIPEQLRGYRLQGNEYLPIADQISQPLKLRLAVEGELISFYRLDTGEKLLIPDEMATALAESTAQLEAERKRIAALEAELARYRQQYGDILEN